MRVILTHGRIMSLPLCEEGQQQKWTLAAGAEHFSFQGFAAHEPAPYGISKRAAIINELAEKGKRLVTGNGVHLAVQGSWICFAMAHASNTDEYREQRTSVLSRYRRASSVAALPASITWAWGYAKASFRDARRWCLQGEQRRQSLALFSQDCRQLDASA